MNHSTSKPCQPWPCQPQLCQRPSRQPCQQPLRQLPFQLLPSRQPLLAGAKQYFHICRVHQGLKKVRILQQYGFIAGTRETKFQKKNPPTPCLQGGPRPEKGCGATATITTTTTITRPKPPCYRGCRAMQVKSLVFFAGFKRDVWYWVGSNVCQKWVR